MSSTCAFAAEAIAHNARLSPPLGLFSLECSGLVLTEQTLHWDASWTSMLFTCALAVCAAA